MKLNLDLLDYKRLPLNLACIIEPWWLHKK